MATSEDGADIFEITDFTTASDFERFVARIEELVHEWKLTSTPEYFHDDPEFDVSRAHWRSVSEEISFIDFPFVVTHHYVSHRLKEMEPAEETDEEYVDRWTDVPRSVKEKWPTTLRELFNPRQPFPDRTHCLCRWFGLTSFVVIYPKSYSLTEEIRIKTVRNAIAVAQQNSVCMVPIFIQSLEAERKFFVGELSMPGVSTSFDTVHLHRVPERYRHLKGVLDIFKGKLNIPVQPEPKALVSIRATYILPDWEKYVFDWPQAVPDVQEGVESPAIGWTGVDTLPFGTCQNPVDTLYLYTMWYNHSELAISENDVSSDIDPLNAPVWTVRVTMVKDIKGLLYESLRKFAELANSTSTFDQAFGARGRKDENGAELTGALERLTDPQTQYHLPSITKVTKAVSDSKLRLSNRAQQDSPIPIDILNKLLVHLFPDAKEQVADTEETLSTDCQWAKETFRCLKTAPVNSLPYKLAVACCLVNYSFGGLTAVAHLWHELVLELRYRLDNSLLVPGVEEGQPDLSQGLLYQKLQMLNCCIKRKTSRESSHTNSLSSEALDEEDEFFDCNSEPNMSVDVEGGEGDQPQGRLRKLEDLKLLHSDNDLYIPVTQDPAPMTEDDLAEHAQVLTRLGTGEEGATLRAKMQSASLISDMESFKAANPGCLLEDFVRWYSPRDFISQTFTDPDTGDTTTTGSLSDRMKVEGNMWQEAWHSAKSVPARRQKRLFNDTKEAEKVLHYLSNLKPADLIVHLLPMACQSAILLIKNQGDKLLHAVSMAVDSMTTELENCTRHTSQSTRLYSPVMDEIRLAELFISRSRALQLKFACDETDVEKSDVNAFVSKLLSEQEVKVVGAASGPVGKTLTDMFAECQKTQQREPEQASPTSRQAYTLPNYGYVSKFPPPLEKEYLLRLVTPRPAPYSQTLPQRMHCTLSQHEFRLCGAFSSDDVFK